MKVRQDFVTNSSSSSFTIINRTDKEMSALDIAISLLGSVFDAAEKNDMSLQPWESKKVTISDDIGDAFESYIRTAFSAFGTGEYYSDGKIELKLIDDDF